jgi:hypothetical protein
MKRPPHWFYRCGLLAIVEVMSRPSEAGPAAADAICPLFLSAHSSNHKANAAGLQIRAGRDAKGVAKLQPPGAVERHAVAQLVRVVLPHRGLVRIEVRARRGDRCLQCADFHEPRSDNGPASGCSGVFPTKLPFCSRRDHAVCRMSAFVTRRPEADRPRFVRPPKAVYPRPPGPRRHDRGKPRRTPRQLVKTSLCRNTSRYSASIMMEFSGSCDGSH